MHDSRRIKQAARLFPQSATVANKMPQEVLFQDGLAHMQSIRLGRVEEKLDSFRSGAMLFEPKCNVE